VKWLGCRPLRFLLSNLIERSLELVGVRVDMDIVMPEGTSAADVERALSEENINAELARVVSICSGIRVEDEV